jgi:hypothetical protein
MPEDQVQAASPAAKIPKTAKEALELWDGMHPVPAFRVETENADQEQVYWAAFECLRTLLSLPESVLGLAVNAIVGEGLTKRESEVALAIAQTARRFGWAKMIEQHTSSGHIPAITIQRPPEMKIGPELEKQRTVASD